MNRNPFGFSFFFVLLSILSSIAPAFAYAPLVTKQVFNMGSYTTVGGKTIPDVRIGWESYGTLNAAKDNVILIPPSFSSTSHAAGKYASTDASSGYWDAIIGSGKAIDTDKYYVISTDTLLNIHALNSKVTTTGPATKNPRGTGTEYGMNFPLITMRDFVNVQKALLDSQGITSLHAVAGLSMGAMQSMEWGNAYPNMVKRIIPVAGHAYSDAHLVGFFDLLAAFIKLDPKWKNGNYYATGQPLDGLREARKLSLLTGVYWQWSQDNFGRAWADGRTSVRRNAFADQYKIEAGLDAGATSYVQDVDANHFLYRLKATQDYIVGHNGSLADELARIKAPILFIYSPNDLLIPADKVCETGRMIRALRDEAGNRAVVEFAEIEGNAGHVDSIFSISQAAARIERFLDREPYETPRRRARRRDGCS
uniref:Probable acyltransferase n=1 Tax=Candidatus Kentrum sp. LPFa TaxID=2126335 RepID=A0A450W0J1_9GAMM|nr:MAG: homoserine O-acetyltransferase [Candidatus Kentron sp. LPFa]VFK27170.1 MAG: homoserine O-acetyltransferase [Candidatus Kentron sp. LPFa]